MSTAREIKAAIGRLPLEERAALMAELCGWTDDEWDRRMKGDAQAGRFTVLNEDAANVYRGCQFGRAADQERPVLAFGRRSFRSERITRGSFRMSNTATTVVTDGSIAK